MTAGSSGKLKNNVDNLALRADWRLQVLNHHACPCPSQSAITRVPTIFPSSFYLCIIFITYRPHLIGLERVNMNTLTVYLLCLYIFFLLHFIFSVNYIIYFVNKQLVSSGPKFLLLVVLKTHPSTFQLSIKWKLLPIRKVWRLWYPTASNIIITPWSRVLE
jgi:hypothetical protein